MSMTFEQAAEEAKNLKNMGNEDLLCLYGLYKQATVGDCIKPFADYKIFKAQISKN